MDATGMIVVKTHRKGRFFARIRCFLRGGHWHEITRRGRQYTRYYEGGAEMSGEYTVVCRDCNEQYDQWLKDSTR